MVSLWRISLLCMLILTACESQPEYEEEPPSPTPTPTCSGKTIQFQQVSSNGTESSTSPSFTVELSSTCLVDVSVDYTTVDGSATAGSDYTAVSGSVTITAGSTTQSITLSVTDDASIEANETFDIQLSNPTASASLGTSTHTYTILDNDATLPADHLVFTTQPVDPTVAGSDILVSVEVQDSTNTVVNSGVDAVANITLNLQSGTGTLNGTLTKAAVAGVASFTVTEAVYIDLIGTKTLRATKADTSGSGGTASMFVDSNNFDIIHAAATQILYTTQPVDPTEAGADILPVLEIQDTYGNTVTTGVDATANVTLSLQSGTGTFGGTLTKAAVGGVITFTATEGANIDLSGTKVIRATKADTSGSGGTTSVFVDSNSFDISSGPATQIVYTTQPVDPTMAGADLLPVLEIRDTYGNTVTTGADATANVTLSLQSGTGTLGGTLTKAASSGVITFTATEGANIDLTGTKVLRATKADTSGSGGTASMFVDSNSFDISNGPATQLVYTTQPVDPTQAGANILPVLEIRDALGNLVVAGIDATANVTLSLQAGTGTLGGTLTKAASGGVITFTATEAVNIDLVGTKTLRATKADTSGSGGTVSFFVDSNNFDITTAAASQLVFTTEPTDPTTAGADLLPVIEIQDAYGNLIDSGIDATANVTLNLQTGTGTFAGTLTKAAVGGVITFTATEAANIDLAGTKVIRATKADTSGSGGTASFFQDSSSFDIVHDVATQVVYTTQPVDPTVAGANLLPVLEIQDAYGNAVTTGADSTANITLSLQSGTGTLGGTLTVMATLGVASFTATEAANIDLVGTKVLRATKADTSGSGGTASVFVDSSSFDISSGPASQLVYTTQPVDPTEAGADILPVLEIRDALGNVVTTGVDATANVTLSLQSGTGTFGGTLTKAASSGVITFTATEAANIDLIGTKIIRATKADTSGSGGTTSFFVDSNGFDINPAAASVLEIAGPTTGNASDCIAFTVGSKDAYTNTSNVSSNTTINLSDAAANGDFYATADTTCSGSTVTSVSMTSGTSSVTFHYKDSSVEAVVLDASATSFTGDTHNINITGCVPDHLHPEIIVAAAVTTNLNSEQFFDVRVTAHTAGHTTETCYTGSKTISWTMNGTTPASHYCGASGGAPVAPSETSLTFAAGVAETTATDAQFSFAETVTVTANDGTYSGNSDSITVAAGAICHVELRDAANNTGSFLTSSSVALNSIDNIYVAGYDKYQGYNSDVPVVWSTNGISIPIPQPGNDEATATAYVVTGTKVESGITLTADYAGGGGELTDTMTFAVTASGNESLSWTSSTTANDGVNTNNLLGSATTNAAFIWDATEGTDTWRTAGTQTWYTEAFASNDRGARQAFPTKAFLIANTNGLDIIDATSNLLWMRFQSGAGNIVDSTYGNIIGVKAVDAKIYLAMRDGGATTGTLVVIDLNNDSAHRYSTSGKHDYAASIDSRNAGSGYGAAGGTVSLSSDIVYDMDAKTIGGIDYILLGLSNRVDLLQDNAGVVTKFSSENVTSPIVNAVPGVAIASGKLYYGEDAVGLHRADVSLPISADFSKTYTYNLTSTLAIPSLAINDVAVSETTSSAEASNNSVVVGTDLGAISIQEHSTPASGSSYFYQASDSGRNTALNNYFYGTNTTATITTSAANGSIADFTVEMFFKFDTTITSGSGDQMLLTAGVGNGVYELKIDTADGSLAFGTKRGSFTYINSTQTTWVADTWYHVAVAYDDTTKAMEMWVDGTHVASGSASGSYAPDTNAPVIGGAAGLSIDEFRLSNSVVYTAPSAYTVPTSDQTGGFYLFHFDDTSTTLTNSGTGGGTASLGAESFLAIDLLSGSSKAVVAVDAYGSGTSTKALLATSSAWTQLANMESATTSAVSDSGAASCSAVQFYQEDSISDLDSLIGVSTGIQLERQ